MADSQKVGAQGGCEPELNPEELKNEEECLLCSPTQALPRPVTNLSVNPNSVVYEPLGAINGGAACIPATTDNLTKILQWIEINIIKPYCDQQLSACTIQISKDDGGGNITLDAEKLGVAIARCLGLSDTNPHIVYDNASRRAIAGIINNSKPNCAALSEMLSVCPPLADTGAIPDEILGYEYDLNNALIVKRYKSKISRLTRFIGQIQFGYAANNRLNVQQNDRLWAADTQAIHHEDSEGGSFSSQFTQYEIGKEGWYRVSASVMLNVTYLALNGWIIAPMLGILQTQYSNNAVTPTQVEFRLDEKVMYLSQATLAGQDVTLTGSVDIYCKPTDVLALRTWYANTFLPGGGDRRVNIWINRSADTVFSVCRINDFDSELVG